MRWVLAGYIAALLTAVAWKAHYLFAFDPTEQPDARVVSEAVRSFGELDRKILADSLQHLAELSVWAKNTDEFCIENEPATLYCVLALAAARNGTPMSENEPFVLGVASAIREFSLAADNNYAAADSHLETIREFNNRMSTRRADLVVVVESALDEMAE